ALVDRDGAAELLLGDLLGDARDRIGIGRAAAEEVARVGRRGGRARRAGAERAAGHGVVAGAGADLARAAVEREARPVAEQGAVAALVEAVAQLGAGAAGE